VPAALPTGYCLACRLIGDGLRGLGRQASLRQHCPPIAAPRVSPCRLAPDVEGVASAIDEEVAVEAFDAR
jgi:hypothetical protein